MKLSVGMRERVIRFAAKLAGFEIHVCSENCGTRERSYLLAKSAVDASTLCHQVVGWIQPQPTAVMCPPMRRRRVQKREAIN